MAKKLCIYGIQGTPDCQQTLTSLVQTATGIEEARINMATGEITYGPAPCPVNTAKLRKAVEDAGYRLEEIEEE